MPYVISVQFSNPEIDQQAVRDRGKISMTIMKPGLPVVCC